MYKSSLSWVFPRKKLYALIICSGESFSQVSTTNTSLKRESLKNNYKWNLMDPLTPTKYKKREKTCKNP